MIKFSIQPINLFRNILLLSVIATGMLLILMISRPNMANATLNLNPDPGDAIPSWVRDYTRNCDSGTQSPSFYDWISASGSLTKYSVDVTYGTTSIPLVYAMASAVCKSNSAVTENNQLFTGASQGVNNIVGKEYRLDYRSGPGDYKIPGSYEGAIVGFDYAPTGGFTTSGTYTVTLYSVAINHFDTGVFLCIGPRKASMGNPTNARDYSKCEPEPTSFPIYVNVKGGPPGGQTFVTCANGFRGIAYDGDDLDQSLAVAIIIDNGKSSQRIIKLTADKDIPTPEFNTTALASFGVNGKKGFIVPIPAEYKDGYAHTYTVIAGDIPVTDPPKISLIGDGNFVCPISFNVTPTGQSEFDDDESPGKVNFSNVGATSDKTVKKVTVSRKYVIIRANNPAVEEPFNPDPAPPSSEETITTAGFKFSDDSRDVSGKNLQIGDKVCVVVTANPGTGEINNGGVIQVSGTIVTKKFCDSVVSKPYVSFYGNDVLVGKGFTQADGVSCATSTDADSVKTFNRKQTDGTYKGSSVQLALSALANIDGIISQGGRSNTSPKILTFANNDPAYTFGGNFGSSNRCIRDLFKPTASSEAPTDEINSMNYGNSQTRFYTGNLSINRPSKIPDGARWTIYVRGNVVINSNIEFASTSWSDKTKIPSFYLIVEGNISIANTVTQLDGVYVAQPPAVLPVPANIGLINTCSRPDGSSYALSGSELFDNCNIPLKVYGSFAAQKVLLNRTANSVRNSTSNEQADSSNAAETFIFSPETLLVEPNIPPETSDIGGVDYYTTLQPVL